VHGGDFDAVRGAGGLDDFGATQFDWREARRLLHRGDAAAGLGAIPGGLAANVLDLFAEKECHVADHDQRGVLHRRNLGSGRIWQRRHRFRFLARTGVERSDLAVADVIGMRMAQQHDVNGAKARVLAAHYRLPGIIKDTHAGRVFEDGRAVAVAQFARVRTERRDLDVLRPSRSAGSRKRKREHAHSKMFHTHSSPLRFFKARPWWRSIERRTIGLLFHIVGYKIIPLIDRFICRAAVDMAASSCCRTNSSMQDLYLLTASLNLSASCWVLISAAFPGLRHE